MKKASIISGLILSSVLGALLIMPGLGFAEETLPTGITTPQGFVTLIEDIANWAWTFLLALAVIFILVAAFNFLTAGGNPEKVAVARQMVIYALVAVAVGALAKGLPILIEALVTTGTSSGGSSTTT